MGSDVVIIPVDAHLLTLTISTPEIVEHSVRVGRETHVQRERIQRTREIKTIRSARLAGIVVQGSEQDIRRS
jgi:hypothetical protein